MTTGTANQHVEIHSIVTRGPGAESTFSTQPVDLMPVPGMSGATALLTAALGNGDASLFRFPAGLENDFHNTDVSTLMFFLAGELEVSTSDGSSVRFGPGSIARFDDATGPGHRSRVVSRSDVLVATVRMSS